MDALPDWAAPVAVAFFMVDRLLAWVEKLREKKTTEKDREASRSFRPVMNCDSQRHDAALATVTDTQERIVVLLDRITDKLEDQGLRSERLHAETQASVNKEIAYTRHALSHPLQILVSDVDAKRWKMPSQSGGGQ